ncbi:MAG: TetR/AcrR family transcriptional regulator [Pseudomonadales bacterium]
MRSERSRAQIIDAMLALIREGDVSPSAARVAERAGVALRTVFRHFEDMDSLYREMSARVESQIMPQFLKPYEARAWRPRLRELVARRAALNEQIFPFRLAGDLRRFQSTFLMEDYRRSLALERLALGAVLPRQLSADPILFAALDMATGFQGWLRLRQDQGLSPAEAEAVIVFTVERLIAGF